LLPAKSRVLIVRASWEHQSILGSDHIRQVLTLVKTLMDC
jgi:hypothetical protein